MHHLEQMVPAAVTAMKNMPSLDPNGILTVHDMADKHYLKFYQDPKYWNADLKEEFLGETRSLWDTTHADKYTGRLFESGGLASREQIAMFEKVGAEMDAAFAKHGPVSPPSHHIEDFYNDIDQKKTDIVRAA